MKRSWSLFLLVLAVVAALGACAAPKPTATPLPAPKPAASPTVRPPPLALANAPTDIAGVWQFHLSGQGGVVQSTLSFTIREYGTYSIDDKLAPMHIEAGTYTISSGKLVLDSDECYDNSTAKFYHCVGTYMASSYKLDGRAVLLHFEMVEDRGDRSRNLNNKTLELDKP
jgi:hypothetical protein